MRKNYNIPENQLIGEGIDPILYNTYFYVEDISGEDGNEIILIKKSYPDWNALPSPILDLKYSYDCINWIKLSTPTIDNEFILIKILPNQKIYFKGNNLNSCYHSITCTKNYQIGGNLMSILYDDNFIGKDFFQTHDSFAFLFNGSKTLIHSHNLILPAIYLTERCYLYLFRQCDNMETTINKLPAQKISRYSYGSMFSDCYKIQKAPEIFVTNFIYHGVNFYYMFTNCYNLNYIKTHFNMEYNNDLGEGVIYTNWLRYVSPTGTFLLPVGSSFADNAPRNGSGIPEGWEIIYFNPETDEIIN